MFTMNIHTSKPNRRGKNPGFTLVEVIVVLVILAILAAIAIPALTGWIDNAKAKTCANNRAQLLRYYLYEQTLYYGEDENVTLTKLMNGEYPESAGDVAGLKCPSGGTYTVDEATGSIRCSIASHNETVVSLNAVDNGMFDAVKGVVLKYPTTNYVDSTSVNGQRTQASLEKFKELGIDPAKAGIQYWSYRKISAADGTLAWTSVDVSKLSNDTIVPALFYDSRTKTYTVWNYKVVTASADGKVSYNVLRPVSEYADSLALPAAQKTDYAQAQAWLTKALKEQGYT